MDTENLSDNENNDNLSSEDSHDEEYYQEILKNAVITDEMKKRSYELAHRIPEKIVFDPTDGSLYSYDGLSYKKLN